MYLLMILVFALGYIVIALEHPLKIDKAATALITGVACWVILAFGKDSILIGDSSIEFVNEQVLFHLGEIAQILFFLLGAMTIVEIIDTESNQETETDKFNRVDILVKDKKGELIIIEIQNSYAIDYFLRILVWEIPASLDSLRMYMPTGSVDTST